MAKRISGELLFTDAPRISRGNIKFKSIEVRADTGETLTWEDISAERAVADQLHVGARGVFYVSKTWGALYGFRPEGGEGVFGSFSANVLALLMSIGMIFAGFFTAVFMFGIVIGLAGIAGLFACLDARNGRAKFNKDKRALRRARQAAP